MSEQTPYNDNELNRQFQNLPLPDEGRSWEKMEAMLKEDDRRRGIVPFFWKYAGWILIALITAGSAWYLLKDHGTKEELPAIVTNQKDDHTLKEKDTKAKKTTEVISENEDELNASSKENVIAKVETTQNNTANGGKKTLSRTNNISPGNRGNNSIKSKTVAQESLPKDQTLISDHPTLTGNNEKVIPISRDEEINDISNNARSFQAIDSIPNNALASSNKQLVDQTIQNVWQNKMQKSSDTTLELQHNNHWENIKDNNSTDLAGNVVQADSIENQLAKNVLTTDGAVSSNINLKQQISTQFVLSAGLGEQQQIPIAGQSSAKYNDNGNAGILKDYIPSVYVQLQKGKWFLNASFKYAGAQYITQNNFYQQTSYEPVTKTFIQQSSFVQKIYYHQLPISFNFEILPNWSVGAGGRFTWLHSTLVENRTKITDAVSNNFISETKQVRAVKAFTDSFFYASPFSAFLQTEYRFNKLSLGVRYSWGIESYMKYTMPDGTVQTQSAQSLQFMLRYRLWETPALKRNKPVLKTPG